MNMIRDFLIKETKARRKREAPKIKRLTKALDTIKLRNKKDPTVASLSVENRLQRQLLELKHPEMTTLPSAQSAFGMYERSEISSRAQFEKGLIYPVGPRHSVRGSD